MDADLGDLTLGTDWPATIRMLLEQKRCWAICLFSLDEEAEHCGCTRCYGKLHGRAAHLLDQPLPDVPRRVTPPADEHPALFPVDVPDRAEVAPMYH